MGYCGNRRVVFSYSHLIFNLRSSCAGCCFSIFIIRGEAYENLG
jgi:hypothetical protein